MNDQAAGGSASLSCNNRAYSFRNTCSFENICNDFLTCYCAKRGFFRCFPNAYITTNPGKHGIPGPYGNREIKSRNNCHDTQRMPLLIHAVPGPFTMHGQAM